MTFSILGFRFFKKKEREREKRRKSTVKLAKICTYNEKGRRKTGKVSIFDIRYSVYIGGSALFSETFGSSSKYIELSVDRSFHQKLQSILRQADICRINIWTIRRSAREITFHICWKTRDQTLKYFS